MNYQEIARNISELKRSGDKNALHQYIAKTLSELSSVDRDQVLDEKVPESYSLMTDNQAYNRMMDKIDRLETELPEAKEALVREILRIYQAVHFFRDGGIVDYVEVPEEDDDSDGVESGDDSGYACDGSDVEPEVNNAKLAINRRLDFSVGASNREEPNWLKELRRKVARADEERDEEDQDQDEDMEVERLVGDVVSSFVNDAEPDMEEGYTTPPTRGVLGSPPLLKRDRPVRADSDDDNDAALEPPNIRRCGRMVSSVESDSSDDEDSEPSEIDYPEDLPSSEESEPTDSSQGNGPEDGVEEYEEELIVQNVDDAEPEDGGEEYEEEWVLVQADQLTLGIGGANAGDPLLVGLLPTNAEGEPGC